MGQLVPREFGVAETHGILLRQENSTHVSSGGLGWETLYASAQHEKPYEDCYSAVDDHLVILHLGGPVAVTRTLGRTPARRVIAPGGLFILPGSIDFGVRLEDQLESLHVYIRKQVVDEVREQFGFGSDAVSLLPSFGDHDPLLEHLGLDLLDTLRNSDRASAVYAGYLAYTMAARLLRQHSTTSNPNPTPQGGFTKLQLQRAIDFMEVHLGTSITLEGLAAATGLSPGHFARRFKTSTGVPPHKYLIHLRVERAKRMLRGDKCLAEIALACGFSHQEHLTRIFRRETGFTPAVFRRLSRS